MSSEIAVEVSALAINVTIPEKLRWTGNRRAALAHRPRGFVCREPRDTRGKRGKRDLAM